MFINTSKQTDHNSTYSVFDTDTGIKYKLTLEPQKVTLAVSSVHTNDFIAYSEDEALSFWEILSTHPNVKPNTNLEWWFTLAFNKADDLLATQEAA
jgi:hypothetical protein